MWVMRVMSVTLNLIIHIRALRKTTKEDTKNIANNGGSVTLEDLELYPQSL